MKVYISEEEDDIIYMVPDKPDWSKLELTEIPDDLYKRYQKCSHEFYEIQELLRDKYY